MLHMIGDDEEKKSERAPDVLDAVQEDADSSTAYSATTT